MRLLVDDLLRNAGIEIGMGLELEDDVQNVHQEQDLSTA